MTDKKTDQQQPSRRTAVDSARASVAAEGLTPSSGYEADAEQYVAGNLTADELVARAERRHRKAAGPADR